MAEFFVVVFLVINSWITQHVDFQAIQKRRGWGMGPDREQKETVDVGDI